VVPRLDHYGTTMATPNAAGRYSNTRITAWGRAL
jgi:hypothetical protein